MMLTAMMLTAKVPRYGKSLRGRCSAKDRDVDLVGSIAPREAVARGVTGDGVKPDVAARAWHEWTSEPIAADAELPGREGTGLDLFPGSFTKYAQVNTLDANLVGGGHHELNLVLGGWLLWQVRDRSLC